MYTTWRAKDNHSAISSCRLGWRESEFMNWKNSAQEYCLQGKGYIPSVEPERYVWLQITQIGFCPKQTVLVSLSPAITRPPLSLWHLIQKNKRTYLCLTGVVLCSCPTEGSLPSPPLFSLLLELERQVTWWKVCDQCLNRKDPTSYKDRRAFFLFLPLPSITVSGLLFLLIGDNMHSFHSFLAFIFFYLLLFCLPHIIIQAKKYQCQSCILKQKHLDLIHQKCHNTSEMKSEEL